MEILVIVLSSVAAVSTITSFTYWQSLRELKQRVKEDGDLAEKLEQSRYINRSITRLKDRIDAFEKRVTVDTNRRIDDVYRCQESNDREYRIELSQIQERLSAIDGKGMVASNDFSSL